MTGYDDRSDTQPNTQAPTPHPAPEYWRVLHLRGDAAHRGEQQGALLAAEIRKAFESIVARYAIPATGADPAWPSCLAELCRGEGLDFREEMAAIARFGRVSFLEAAAVSLFDDVWERLGCTTIANPQERDGGTRWTLLHFTDLPSDLPAWGALVRVVEPEGLLGWVGPGWPGMVGTYDGMNAAGVAIAANIVEWSTPTAHAWPVAKQSIARTLQTARSAEQAAIALSRSPLSVGLVGIAIDDRQAWQWETPATDTSGPCEPQRLSSDRPHAVTNHPLSIGAAGTMRQDWRDSSVAHLAQVGSALAKRPSTEGLWHDALLDSAIVRRRGTDDASSALVTHRATTYSPADGRIRVSEGVSGEPRASTVTYRFDTLMHQPPGWHVQLAARSGRATSLRAPRAD